MPLLSMEEFERALVPQQRLLGLDVGEKTIGIALSDAMHMIATPLQTITRGKFSTDAALLRGIIDKQGVGGLIIGYPVNMDGTEGPRCQSTRQFARNLDGQFTLPVLLWDERMSTMAVERTMLDADLSRQRRDELVDKMAASYILQGLLDRLHALKKGAST